MRYRVFALLVVGAAGPAAARPPGDRNPEAAAAIGKNAEAFVEAFGKGDAAAVAAFWAPDGEYAPLAGPPLHGREAIEKAFRGLFEAHKGLKVRVESDSLRFLTPEVAVEDGTTAVVRPDGAPPSRARYAVVHVKKDGKWLLGSVRETAYVPPGNYEHLRGLEWAVGDWAGGGDKGPGERLSVAWTDNQNFLVASFAATADGVTVGRATHWVGWDPRAKKVRSWAFDAAGGFGEGAWAKDGDKWVVKTTSVLQDGKEATATLVLGPGEGGTLTLLAKDRTVDGKPVPDGKEVTLKRVK